MAETKYEKSVSSLSSKIFDCYNSTLPKHVFRGFFTWSCYENFNSLTFRTWLLLWLPLIIGWKLRGKMCYSSIAGSKRRVNRRYPVTVTILMFLVLYCLWTNSYIFRERTLGKQVSQFAKEIIKNTPGTDIENWERVAENFNFYLYENKLWNTKYFFFDGNSCHEAFRKTVLEPFALEKDDAAKNKTFKDSVPYIEEALQVYIRQVDRQWHSINSERCLPNIEIRHLQFQKHCYGSKLLWAFKRVTINNPRFLCLCIAYMNGILIAPRIRTSLNVLCLFFVLLCLTIEYLIGMDRFRFQSMTLVDKMRFLSYISCEYEKSDAGSWARIVKRTNAYLFEQKIWNSEVLFSDGIDCEKFFIRHFSAPASSQAHGSVSFTDCELWPYIKEIQSACDDV